MVGYLLKLVASLLQACCKRLQAYCKHLQQFKACCKQLQACCKRLQAYCKQLQAYCKHLQKLQTCCKLCKHTICFASITVSGKPCDINKARPLFQPVSSGNFIYFIFLSDFRVRIVSAFSSAILSGLI